MKHQIMTVMLDAFLIINALPLKFLQKRFPPTFSMVHLLHRLYGVDAPVESVQKRALRIIYSFSNNIPYCNSLDAADIASLSTRRNQISRNFFIP